MKTKIWISVLALLLLAAGCGGMSKDEKLALEYYNVYVNGTNQEDKAAFVEKNIHADAKPLFELALMFGDEANTGSAATGARVAESVKITEGGETSTLVLIQANGTGGEIEEHIVLMLDGKVGFSFAPNGDEDMFAEVRSNFKTK